MPQSTRSGCDSDDFSTPTTVVGRRIVASFDPDRTGSVVAFVQEPWFPSGDDRGIAPPIEAPPPIPTATMLAPPPSSHEFVARVSALKGVQYIVVELIDDGVCHITTFATPLSPELRAAIHDVEADLILAHKTETFDFHLRRSDELLAPPTAPLSERHLFAVWSDDGQDA